MEYTKGDLIDFIDPSGHKWTFELHGDYFQLKSSNYPGCQKNSVHCRVNIELFFKTFTDKGSYGYLNKLFPGNVSEDIWPVLNPRYFNQDDVDKIVRSIRKDINARKRIIEKEKLEKLEKEMAAAKSTAPTPAVTGKSANPFENMFPGMDFGMITDNRIQMSIKGAAFLDTKTGNYKVYDPKRKQIINVGNFVIPGIPFMKVPVKKSKLKSGDIIIVNDNFYIFDSISDKTGALRVINPVSATGKNLIEEVNLLGLNFYTKVVSMMNFGKSDSDMGSMGKMMMMSSMMGGGSPMGGDNPMQAMMMMSLLGGEDFDFDFDFFDEESKSE